MEPWGRQAACPPSDGDRSPSCAGHCQGPAPSWEPVTQRGATQGHPVSGPVRDHLLDTQSPSRCAPKPDAHLNPCTQPDPGPGRSPLKHDGVQRLRPRGSGRSEGWSTQLWGQRPNTKGHSNYYHPKTRAGRPHGPTASIAAGTWL